MKTTRKLSRRSFFGRVVGATVAGGAMLTLTSQSKALQVTDSDEGATSDPPGQGRGTRRIARCSDADSGAHADPANNGRGNGRTDSDAGANSDPPNCGRR